MDSLESWKKEFNNYILKYEPKDHDYLSEEILSGSNYCNFDDEKCNIAYKIRDNENSRFK